MARRRKDLDLTQLELASRVGTSQNMISNIESGGVTSSKFVLPICRALSIPPPMFFESEDQKSWSQLGHVLRGKSMKKFKLAMALVESMVDDEEPESRRSERDQPAANNDNRKPPASK